MNSNTHLTPNPETSSERIFDVESAYRERLNWRLGGDMPTERALGLDDAMSREVEREMSTVRMERIRNQLGDTAVESRDT